MSMQKEPPFTCSHIHTKSIPIQSNTSWGKTIGWEYTSAQWEIERPQKEKQDRLRHGYGGNPTPNTATWINEYHWGACLQIPLPWKTCNLRTNWTLSERGRFSDREHPPNRRRTARLLSKIRGARELHYLHPPAHTHTTPHINSADECRVLRPTPSSTRTSRRPTLPLPTFKSIHPKSSSLPTSTSTALTRLPTISTPLAHSCPVPLVRTYWDTSSPCLPGIQPASQSKMEPHSLHPTKCHSFNTGRGRCFAQFIETNTEVQTKCGDRGLCSKERTKLRKRNETRVRQSTW